MTEEKRTWVDAEEAAAQEIAEIRAEKHLARERERVRQKFKAWTEQEQAEWRERG